MKVRSISEYELPRFINEVIIPSDYEKAYNFTIEQWKTNESKPDWYFVIEKDQKFIGRLFFWKLGQNTNSFYLSGLSANNETPLRQIVLETLLKRSVRKLMEITQVATIKFAVQAEVLTELLAEVLGNTGFEVVQKKNRLKATNLVKANYHFEGVTSKSLSSLGRTQFIKYIELVSQGTLDEDDRAQIQEFGSLRAAESYFELLKSIDYQPHQWMAFFDQQNNFVGLVVPQTLNESTSTIGYLGVSPSHRGQNYSKQILEYSLKVLNDSQKTKKLVVDVDERNTPLLKHLNSVGFIRDYTTVVYRLFTNKL